MPSDKKKPDEPVDSKYESAQEQEESELKQDQLDSITNDHAQTTPAMGKMIDKKELTLADFENIRNDFDLQQRIIIFRQRSLRKLAEGVKKHHPELFKKSDLMKKPQNYRFTRQRDQQLKDIEEVREAESKLGVLDRLRKHTNSRMKQIEDLTGKIDEVAVQPSPVGDTRQSSRLKGYSSGGNVYALKGYNIN